MNGALQTATNQVARMYMTGQTAGMTQQQFLNAVCTQLPKPLFDCANLAVSVQQFPSWQDMENSGIGPATPIYSQQTFLGQTTYTLNAAASAYSSSAPGAVVVLRAMYDWPTLKPPFGFANQPNGSFLMLGTSVFEDEPYNNLVANALTGG